MVTFRDPETHILNEKYVFAQVQPFNFYRLALIFIVPAQFIESPPSRSIQNQWPRPHQRKMLKSTDSALGVAEAADGEADR